jgi:hypothetical protein
MPEIGHAKGSRRYGELQAINTNELTNKQMAQGRNNQNQRKILQLT